MEKEKIACLEDRKKYVHIKVINYMGVRKNILKREFLIFTIHFVM